MYKHWVARASIPYEPFNDFETARWFWIQFKKLFPEMISAILMPNHFHLILDHKIDASRKIGGLLAATTERLKIKRLWQKPPIPIKIEDLKTLRRQVRYVALNPCRSHLSKDPLEWYWSTYRDVMGAAVNPVVDSEKLSKILKVSYAGFQVRFHHYVSGDPTVSVSGTPPPKPHHSSAYSEKSIMEILAAAAAALRVDPAEVRKSSPLRKLFVLLASKHGWHRPTYLAEICGITTAGAHYILANHAKKGIVADGITEAELCLGDTRLRKSIHVNRVFIKA